MLYKGSSDSLRAYSPDYFPQTPQKKENTAEQKLDVAVVFGEGPVLPILLPDEATEVQREAWEAFNKDPQHQKQPDFYLLTEKACVTDFDAIEASVDVSDTQKERQKLQLRHTWQHTSRFALKRIGRFNALAAGDALFHGKVEKLILSGGRTIPHWKRDDYRLSFIAEFPEKVHLPREILEKELDHYLAYSVNWPSEAELMRDVIVRTYGWSFFHREYRVEQLNGMYEKKTGESGNDRDERSYKVFEHSLYKEYVEKELDARILIEDKSMNTLDNIIFSMNKYPQEMIGEDKRIGLFASDWQRSRALLLAERFLLHVNHDAGISSQRYLRDRAVKRKKVKTASIMNTLMDRSNPPVAEVSDYNDRLVLGLIDEEYANYWAGWLFKIEDPEIFVSVLKQFDNPKWRDAMQQEFHKVGLNFAELTEENLLDLAEADPLAYQQIIDKGVNLTTPAYRKILPHLEAMRHTSSER